MATDGADLLRLQALDSEADAARRRLAEAEARLGESEALRRARQELEYARALLRQREQRQRSLEAEIGGLAEKIAQDESRLYSGSIRSARELADLQAEVLSEQRRRGRLEDDLLTAMIEREEAEAAHAARQADLQQVEAEWSAVQAALQAECEQLRERLRELAEQRSALLPKIAPGDLAVYQNLRQRKGGVAVAQVVDDACSACGVSVTQGRKWELREGQRVTCSNCERILVLIGRA